MLGIVVDVELHLNFTVPPSSDVAGNTFSSVSGCPGIECNFLFTDHSGSVTTGGGVAECLAAFLEIAMSRYIVILLL